MKTRVLLFIPLLLIAPWASHSQSETRTKLSQAEVKALVQAVQDEIYDYGYQEYFFPEGGPVGDVVTESRARVPLYIKPLLENGQGEAIYKLMPYGEVLRFFYVHGDGTVVLESNPELGFPASQPNRKTVYLKDAEVAHMKREWVKSSFDIDLSPSPERVQDAVGRQKQRNDGFSAWEFVRSKEGKKPQ